MGKRNKVTTRDIAEYTGVESLCLKGYRGLTVCVLWSKFKVVKEV